MPCEVLNIYSLAFYRKSCQFLIERQRRSYISRLKMKRDYLKFYMYSNICKYKF